MSDLKSNSRVVGARRIVVACHAWYDDMVGGSFRLASEFAMHLASRGHDVHYVCSQPTVDSCLAESENCDGVRVWRYPLPERGLNGLKKMRAHLARTRQIVRALHDEAGLDAVSGHSPLQALGAARAVQAKRWGRGKAQSVFVNYTVHSPFDDELRSNEADGARSLQARLAALAARRVDGQNVRLADRVQTDSNYTQSRFIEKFGLSRMRHGIVAPGWVDTERFAPAEDRRQLGRELGPDWDCDVPVFFTLRRLQQRMGLDTLIDACAVLHQQGRQFRMLIGVGGPLLGSLQGRIDAHGLQSVVRLMGRLDEAILANVYAAADCFVLPTRALECFGLIVLEALACDTPVIGSDVAAIPELVSQQGEQWLFPPGDVAALADRMRGFLDGTLVPDRDLRGIATNYDREKVLDRWEQLLLSPEVLAEVEADASGR